MSDAWAASGVDLEADLRAIVGDAHVITDPEVRAGFEIDATRRYQGEARCVVRPADEAAVAAVVRVCAAYGAAIVPQGGNTGLVGGAIPRRREVILSLTRLQELGEVDVASAQVTAGAGVTIERLQQHARAAGLDFGVDWGARAVATVGGAVSTNAGGSRVLRFGTFRAQVLGVRAVLADGTIVGNLNGLPKETVGPFLPAMFVGAEGTLGIVTAVRLKLVPRYTETVAAFVAFATIDHAVRAMPELRRRLDDLDGLELILPGAFEFVSRFLGTTTPAAVDGAGAYVIVDCAGRRDPTESLTDALSTLADDPRAGLLDAVVATDRQREQLFELRDAISPAISATAPPLKLDVAVPVVDLQRLAELTRAAVDELAPEALLVEFGHLAEGNLHVNILHCPEPRRAALSARILGAVIDLGGTVSAEHGIGIAKTEWLTRVRGEAEVAVLRSVKAALDPNSLFNPGVLLPDAT